MLAIHSLVNRCIEMDLDPADADRGDKENSEVRQNQVCGSSCPKSIPLVWCF